ncbi:G-protein coupled receptor daf-37-like [Tubulanus polymorphus]|uniref:G-protein coupled receptor daf-37-like n=1 Tax=Tubulanus polymorphus TaxID=672921 RepID=UPI003DA5163B
MYSTANSTILPAVATGSNFSSSASTVKTTTLKIFRPHLRCKTIHYADYKPFYLNMFYQVMNYVIFSVGLFGVCGNFLSFLILFLSRSKNTSIFYLRCLAVTDLFTCLSFIVFGFYAKLYSHTLLLDMSLPITHTIKRLYSYTQNFRITFSGINDLLIVLVAVERYVVVCWPLKAAQLVTKKGARIKVVAAVFVTLIFDTKRYFMYKTNRTINPCTGYERWAQKLTTFGKSKTLKYLDLFVSAPLLTLTPAVVVLAVTVRLVLTLKTAESDRGDLSGGSTSNSKPSNERSLTVTLIAISCLFLVKKSLYLYGAINNLISFYRGSSGMAASTPYTTRSLDLLRMSIASANFFIYCASRRRFRKQLLELFRCGGTATTLKQR